MPDPRRILVVSGARALRRTRAAKLWALRELAARIYSGEVDTVAHGVCRGSPDDWSDHLAHNICSWGEVVDVVRWAMPEKEYDPKGAYKIVNGDFVLIKGAERYPYATPLERNAAMARWAGDMLRAGLDVRALTLRCDWPLVDGERATQGTAHARDRLVAALGAARVTDLVCPRELGPAEVVFMHATEASPRRGVVDFDARKGGGRG